MAVASRDRVPSSSMSATKLAVPGRRAGSVSSPAATTISTVTRGMSCFSTTHTGSPFLSL